VALSALEAIQGSVASRGNFGIGFMLCITASSHCVSAANAQAQTLKHLLVITLLTRTIVDRPPPPPRSVVPTAKGSTQNMIVFVCLVFILFYASELPIVT
jgi:Ca2+/H+ antiporter